MSEQTPEAFETGALVDPEATEEELLALQEEPEPEDTSIADPDADVEVDQDPNAIPEDFSGEIDLGVAV